MKAADAAQSDTFAALKESAARINALFPGAVTMPTDDTKREASLYLNASGVYLYGRLNYNGTLYPDRLGSVPSDKVEGLLAFLSGKTFAVSWFNPVTGAAGEFLSPDIVEVRRIAAEKAGAGCDVDPVRPYTPKS